MKRTFQALNTPMVAGALVAVFGAGLALQWGVRLPGLLESPFFGKTGLNGPLLFLVAGTALIVGAQHRSGARNRWTEIGAVVLIGYPALILSQTLFKIDLGLDFVRVPTVATLDNLHPGRLSPNASVAPGGN